MSRLTVLGAGTLLPHATRGSAAHAVEWGDGELFLLDCGSGTLHGMARAGIPWDRLSLLVLSHYHTDHIGDLLPILWASRHGGVRSPELPLTVVGPPGLEAFWRGLRQSVGGWVDEVVSPLERLELPSWVGEREWEGAVGKLHLRSHPVTHPSRLPGGAVAWRITLPTVSVGYTGDTGPTPGLGDFFEGVDALVAECGQVDPPTTGFHFTPRSVAQLADEAAPGLLLLTHRPPELPGPEALDLLRRAGYTGRALAPMDGFRVTLLPRAGRPLRSGPTS